MLKKFNIILAIDKFGGIGYHNVITNLYYIPWKSKKDMAYFKSITTYTKKPDKQNAVIMGYNTWLSICKPLPDRYNVVITSRTIDGVNNTFTTFDTALEYLSNNPMIDKIFVIGGAKLYDTAFNHYCVKNVYLTTIEHDYKCNIKIKQDFTKFNLVNRSSCIDNDMLLNFYQYKKREHGEQQYLDIMKKILDKGTLKNARNGDTISLFDGSHMSFDMSDGKLPVLTTKKIFLRGVFEELMFFITGDTNTNHLKDKGVGIWSANTTREFLDSVGLTSYDVGDIGTAYSFQFRYYGAEYEGMHKNYTGKGVDQFAKVINDLITNRFSRRILMTTYNPAQVHKGPLPPCHGIAIQFGIEDDNKLSCHMYQRSTDWFLGVPWNITSYAFLLLIVIELVNNSPLYTGPKLIPHKLLMSFGDIHLYENSIESAKKQIKRIPFEFPTIEFTKTIKSLDELKWTDIKISNYKCLPNDFGVAMIA